MTVEGQESLTGDAARSFGWQAFAFGLNRLLVFVTTLVLARLLVSKDFGVVAAGMTVVLFFEIALDLGVGAAVVYEQHKGITSQVQTAFTLNLTAAAGLTAFGVLVVPWLASFFHLPGHEWLFRALFLYLLIRGAGQVQDSILRRDLRFGRRMWLDVTRGVIRAVVSIVLAGAGAGAWAMVVGLLTSELAATVLAWVLVPFRPTFRIEGGASRVLLRFGLVVLALKVVDAINLDADYLIVGNRLGADALGYYTIGYRLPELLLFNVFWIVSSVAFPAYSKVRVLGGSHSFGRAMLRTLQVLSLYAFPVGVGLALMARDLVVVLFGTRWLPAVGPMQMVALAAAFGSVGYASGDIYAARGRPGTLLKINAPVAVAMVIAMYVLAPRGITAVAAVHLVGSVGYALVRLHLANRLVGTTMRQTLIALRPALSAAAGLAGFVLPLRLTLSAGAASLALLIAAGAAGALLGLLVGDRSAVGDLIALGRTVRSG